MPIDLAVCDPGREEGTRAGVAGIALGLAPGFCCCFITKLYLALCDPMNRIPPGSSVLAILQARILEWVAIPFSGDLANPGIEAASPAL